MLSKDAMWGQTPIPFDNSLPNTNAPNRHGISHYRVYTEPIRHNNSTFKNAQILL